MTHATVELECDCGNTVILTTANVRETECECGRKYLPELRIHLWEKDEPTMPDGRSVEER